MDATSATSNCCTSIVHTVLYSGCTEAAASCSPYCTCIQYVCYAPTVQKKQSPNSSWWNHKQQDNNQQEQQVNNAQTHKEWEGDRGRARSWEGKEGRQQSLRKEAMNVEFAKKTNVTPQWMQTGQCRIIVSAYYKRYCTEDARRLP